MNSGPLEGFHLDVDPAVVFQLGETLISDEVQAIVELVKNAYDADATFARVVVATDAVTTEATSFFPRCSGTITVEDDGTGMDLTDIRRGWLLLANSPKAQAKQDSKRKTPKFQRTPLGDKGLGRLGVQRLGDVVDMFTSKIYVTRSEVAAGEIQSILEEPEGVAYHVGIDWREFSRYSALSEVPVHFQKTHDPPPKRGTRIVAAALRDPSVWQTDAIAELQRKLGQIIFPFSRVRPFHVYATVNGEALDLAEVTDAIRSAATSRFQFSYHDGVLKVVGRFKLTAFRPPNSRDQESYQGTLVRDRGGAFYRYLRRSSSVSERTGVSYSEEEPWFLMTLYEKRVEELAELALTMQRSEAGGLKMGQFADPGPFEGELDTFDLGRNSPRAGWQGTYNDFNEAVKRHSGVRVFRDGFAIRPYGMEGNDWLGLGAAQTAGASFYSIRPRNVIGFVQITAADNAQLIEKTDREAFTDTPHTRNFLRFMQEVVDAINTSTTLLRRGYGDFRKEQDKASLGLSESQEPRALYERIRSTARDMANLDLSAAALVQVAEHAEQTAADLKVEAGNQAGRNLDQYLLDLQQIVSAGRAAAAQVQQQSARAKQLELSADILERELGRMNEDLMDFAQLAALGLTAEAVSHEIRTIAANLSLRTRDVLGHVRTRDIRDATVIAYAEHVRSSVSALRKQLAHLAPGLRYVREVTEMLDMRNFIREFASFHSGSFARRAIKVVVDDSGSDFRVNINRGKLTQVLDNLLFNSRYWLIQDLTAGRITAAQLHLGVGERWLTVWDTGRGIDQSVENTLFEPFVTNKPKGSGRGLGLFIARQLLQSSGCDIELTPERNEFGNLFRFRIDFTGALAGNE